PELIPGREHPAPLRSGESSDIGPGWIGYHLLKRPVAIPEHAHVPQAHPEAAVVVGGEAENARKGVSARRIRDAGAARAVEADEAGFGSDPEIPVSGLSNRIYRSVREALLSSPLIVNVLREGPMRIDGV